MQNDYFLFTKFCTTQINFILALGSIESRARDYNAGLMEEMVGYRRGLLSG